MQAEATLTGYTSTVTWITVDEKDVRNFDIQRSTDASVFTTVTNKEAKGNTYGKSVYSIKDDIASLSDVPVVYYRVQMNDQDGQKSFSNTVTIRPTQTSDPISIFPSPFTNKFTVSYPAEELGTVTLKLTDMLGKVVELKEFEIVKGTNYLELDKLETLSIGSYFVNVINHASGDQFIKKIQKK